MTLLKVYAQLILGFLATLLSHVNAFSRYRRGEREQREKPARRLIEFAP